MTQSLIRAEDRVLDALVLTAVVTFVVIATYRIHLPGLYYDEVLFVNAARGGPQDYFIFARFGHLPIMVMPYLGALKAWLYYPVFAALGVSPLTIRLPIILVAATTILVYYFFIRKIMGRRWACAVAWFMALSPAFLFTSRLDWGPVVLMQFFKAVILFLWFAYLEKPALWKLMGIGVCGLLGFFDKFNFIWLVLAFSGGVLLVYPEKIQSVWYSLSPRLRFLAAIVSLTAALAVAFLVTPLVQLPVLADSGRRISENWNGILTTLSGTAVAEFIFGSSKGFLRFEPWGTILPAMLAGVACLLPRNSAPNFLANRKAGWFCITAMFLVSMQIAFTPQAGGPHHYVMLFPFPLLALAFCSRAIAEHLDNRHYLSTARAFIVIIAGSALLLAFANATNTFIYLKHFKTSADYNPRWSPAIYKLAKFIGKKGDGVNKIVCVDWGIANQLEAISLTAIGQKIEDCWAFFNNLPESTNPNYSNDLAHVFSAGHNLAICFAQSRETFPATRSHFLARINSQLFHARLLTTINARDHEEIYEIYEIMGHSDLSSIESR